MIGCETEIKLQNISKQEFSCNRSSLGVPVLHIYLSWFKGVRSSISPQVRLKLDLVRLRLADRKSVGSVSLLDMTCVK